MEPPIDPSAVRFALERQLAVLTLVADHLQVAALDPITAGAIWRGPAASAAAELAADRRRRTREVAQAVDDRRRELSVTIAVLS